MLTPTLVLDDLFDPAKGWPFSANQVPLTRRAAPDGNPFYHLVVDGIELQVAEKKEWEDGVTSRVAPTRLVVLAYIMGVTITDATVFASANADTFGLPALGIDGDGDVTIAAAIPFEDGFPLDLLRKQLMVCIGLVVETTAGLLLVWNTPDDARQRVDWEAAARVAGVAGQFLRAFLD
ncbi:hypothetical protein ABIQ69_16455 [Agromyces sp. G08B096]|uniref:Uncharacterized protein n=1 Tax=Agromyces sp. G08B096 TaxID=3156399 RepID=A0AAU7W611_9MICO